MDIIHKWLTENRITEVEVLVPDMTGNARGKFIPAAKYMMQDSPRLPEGILAQAVNGDYPDDYWELLDPRDRDMILRADPSTMRVVPWAKEPTAQIIHDCVRFDGAPVDLSPRNVLRRVDATTIRTFSEIYEYVAPGCLLDPDTVPEHWRDPWMRADPTRFGTARWSLVPPPPPPLEQPV